MVGYGVTSFTGLLMPTKGYLYTCSMRNQPWKTYRRNTPYWYVTRFSPFTTRPMT